MCPTKTPIRVGVLYEETQMTVGVSVAEVPEIYTDFVHPYLGPCGP
jgi:hypothetical protein